MDAYTNFPDYCCLCLRPSPDSTWKVSNGQSKHLDGGRYEVTSVSTHVPVCSSCRWNMRMREVAAAVGALVIGALALGWWYLETKGHRGYLIGGAIGALILCLPAFLVLGWLFNVPTHRSVAYIEVDGSDITFANPEYQRMYTGEARLPGQRKPKIHEGQWR